ncbi:MULTISPECIES: N-acetylmuramoyl-L-alanine amidase [Rhodomicrobium]|uniref:N-acetylmuramoyl-L-alanine amidase n=1 Tax=Rhodomicrobium TaxID=1068 RepID=UPI000B4BE58F|nr:MULTISPECIES: N-acetylmuramoyl-L-alanine amidase [Rhodomicrobium]
MPAKLLIIAIAAILLAFSPAQAAGGGSSAVAKDARVGGDLTRTRFVADLSETVDFRAFLLSDPYRVIVDLPEVKFLMPTGIGASGKGLISAFRYGLFAPGKSRIVIDVVEPVLIDKAFVRAAENGQPARLVIDLVRTTPAEFDKQRKSQTLLRSMSPGDFQTSMEEPSDPAKETPAPGGGPKKKLKPVIVLDPGHGGVDPGAISPGGQYEKNVVFAFCKVLKAKLEETGQYRVLMTREEDIFVPLDLRVDSARKEQADLLISVHADALDLKHPLLGGKVAKDVRGASIYTLSEDASDDLAKIIAARENRSDVLAGVELPGATDDDLASILIDLMHRETKNLSVTFAKQLLSSIRGQMEMTGSPHRFANFKVLKAQDVPSVLLELGYLSNVDDESALTSDKWRTKVSDAIVDAIGAFFAKRMVSVPG